MPAIHTALYAFGLLLQFGLLLLLFQRRIALRVFTFTILIFFYSIRSALLSVLLHSVARPAYAQWFDAFSIVDILLQLAVAFALTRAILHLLPADASKLSQTRTAPTRTFQTRILWVPLILLLSAGVLTALLSAILPSHSHVPADRATLFCGFLFMLLFGWSLLLNSSRTIRLERPQRAVLAGLTMVGATNLLTQSMKSIAAFDRNAHAFVFWSYVSVAVYLLVLIYWIFQCKWSVQCKPELVVFRSEGEESASPWKPQDRKVYQIVP